MNKLFVSLLTASIAALVLAIGCGTWLFLQSWEEGKRLERQNRELQASLEASRVRLENFCDYPVEALCNLEEPRGTVSSVMSGLGELTPPLPEPAQSANSADLRPKEELPAPAEAPAAKEAQAESVPSPDAKTSLPAVVSSAFGPETPLLPLDTRPQVRSEDVKAPTPQPEPSSPVQTENVPAASAEEQIEEAPQSAPPALPKKTWSTLEVRNAAMTLRIAGEGDTLTARGELLQNPPRYEVTLQGQWKISNRRPSTKLVRELQILPAGENTRLVFELNDQPEHCEIQQEDSRTIAVIIR